jgi:hypothetical protein
MRQNEIFISYFQLAGHGLRSHHNTQLSALLENMSGIAATASLQAT